MRKLLAGLLLLLAAYLAPTDAHAQCSGAFPNNTFCGNNSGATNVPTALPIPVFSSIQLDALCSTNNDFLVRLSGLWQCGTFGTSLTLSGGGTLDVATQTITNNTNTGQAGTGVTLTGTCSGTVLNCNIGPGSGNYANVTGNSGTTVTTNYTIQTTDCGSTIRLGGTAFYTVTVPATAGFVGRCVVILLNMDTTRGKAIANDPGCTTEGILWPGQNCTLVIESGASWLAAQPAGRWRLPGTTPGANSYFVYVDGTNGNNGNDGLAPSTGAVKSCQKAIDLASSNFDANQQYLAIAVVDATDTGCTSGVNLKPILGIYDFWPNSPLLLCGSAGSGCNGSAVSWNCGANVCITGLAVAGWRIQGFSFNVSGAVFHADAGAHIYVGTNTNTGNPSYVLESTYQASLIEVVGNLTTNDTAETSFGYSVFGAQIIFIGTTSVTVTNNIAYSTNGFFSLNGLGNIIEAGTTFAGGGASGATGNAFVAINGSYINYGQCSHYGSQGNSLYIPGNAAGTNTGAYCQ